MSFPANCLPLANWTNRFFDKFNLGKTAFADIRAKLAAGNAAFGEKKIKKRQGHLSDIIWLVKIFNRKARHKYQILEKVESGIVLTGAEIKSIRAGRVDLSESFARVKEDEVFLVNAHILPWKGSEKFSDARRQRKLLLHRRQILNWQGKIAGKNLTLVPLSIYIKGNLAKVELALAKSKAKFDRRAALKKQTINRDIERELKEQD